MEPCWKSFNASKHGCAVAACTVLQEAPTRVKAHGNFLLTDGARIALPPNKNVPHQSH